MIRGAAGGLSSLSELPETEIEAINFSKIFRGKKELFFGRDANIENLTSLNLDNVNVLSFSTHGVLAGEVDGVKSSSIVLSPTNNNNGLITADWLFSITGSPRLAILSTCNSGTSAQPLIVQS
jgi:CHAT domain-containing protein